jgi:hypothetical protein
VQQPSGNCLGKRGTGTFSASIGSPSTCSALGSVALNVNNAPAEVDQNPTGAGAAIILMNPSTQQYEALVLELTACPGAAGTLAIGAGAEAVLYTESPNAGAHLSLYAAREAISGTVTITSAGAILAGSATLGFDGGGTGTASFTVQ